jgi:hypothetical protein
MSEREWQVEQVRGVGENSRSLSMTELMIMDDGGLNVFKEHDYGKKKNVHENIKYNFFMGFFKDLSWG